MGKGRHLAEFELYLLLALAHLGEGAYGVTIRREIERRSGRPVAIGAVYATLARLEEKGLVRFTITEPRPVPGGRSRKCVTLTRSGERALQRSADMLLRMLRGLEPRLALSDQ